MSYILSKKAEEDIIGVFLDGAGRFGIAQAEHYMDELEKSLEFLSNNPEAARQRFELTPPVRIHPSRSHMIIYTQQNNGDIFIIRVRHVHEDWVNC